MKENKSFVSNQQLVNKVNQKQENGKKQWLLGSFRAKQSHEMVGFWVESKEKVT